MFFENEFCYLKMKESDFLYQFYKYINNSNLKILNKVKL